MNPSEKIEAILKHLDLNAKAFADALGYERPQIIYDIQKGKTKRISPELADKITSVFSEISRSWLLADEGDMFVVDTEDKVYRNVKSGTRQNMIPLIHVDSVGGVHSENALTPSEQYVERLVPFPDVHEGDVAILQSGDSMTPTIPAGAILQIRKVESWREYFGYGGDFVLWLKDGRRITKQVLKYSPDPANYITCHSYNPEAADEELPKSMVREVWKVVNVLINKGW